MPRYIILRDPPATRGRGGIKRMGGAPATAQIEIDELSPQAASALAGKRGVRLAVRSMPVRLIKPLDFPAPAAAGTAWGVKAVGADKSQYTGQGVTVAVLDTGIDATHPAFSNVQIIEKDFSGNGDGDVVGHGTHCAGTIFGGDVHGERIGVAPGVSRALIGKVFGDDGSGTTEAVVQGLNWAADNGANIISMSLGFDFPGMVTQLIKEDWPDDVATSAALEAYRGNLRLFDSIMGMIRAGAASSRNPMVIAASGNESRRDDDIEFCITASLPGAAEDVICVGAVGEAGDGYKVADFSNTLPNFAAPGVGIKSAWPGGGLHTISGTSMACPHVAGVAALWWEAVSQGGRAATPKNVSARLFSSARSKVFPEGFSQADYGEGMVSAP